MKPTQLGVLASWKDHLTGWAVGIPPPLRAQASHPSSSQARSQTRTSNKTQTREKEVGGERNGDRQTDRDDGACAPLSQGRELCSDLGSQGERCQHPLRQKGHSLRGEGRGPQPGGRGPRWHQERWGKRADGQEKGPVGGELETRVLVLQTLMLSRVDWGGVSRGKRTKVKCDAWFWQKLKPGQLSRQRCQIRPLAFHLRASGPATAPPRSHSGTLVDGGRHEWMSENLRREAF